MYDHAHEVGALIQMRGYFPAIRSRAHALGADANEELERQRPIIQQRDELVRDDVLQLAAVADDIHVSETHQFGADGHRHTVGARRVEVVLSSVPVDVIRGSVYVEVGAWTGAQGDAQRAGVRD